MCIEKLIEQLIIFSLGHSLPLSLHVYFQAPIGLLPILLEDARGVALPCVIC